MKRKMRKKHVIGNYQGIHLGALRTRNNPSVMCTFKWRGKKREHLMCERKAEIHFKFCRNKGWFIWIRKSSCWDCCWIVKSTRQLQRRGIYYYDWGESLISQKMKDNSRFLSEKAPLLQQCFWHHFTDFIPNHFYAIKIEP